MRNIYTCLCALAVVFVLASCQKELHFDATEDPEAGDTLLKKIVQVDSMTPMKDIYNVDFVYDSQKRVTKIRRYYVDSVNGAAIVTNSDSTVFYYNGTEKLPVKSKGYSSLVFSYETETFHRFQPDGRLAVDSVPAGDGISYAAMSFTYSPSKVIAKSAYWVLGISIGEADDSFVVASNNLAQAFFAYTPSYGPTYFADTYDNRINPLSKMNIASTLVVEGELAYNQLIFLAPGYCANNIINRKSSLSYPPSSSENQSYTYVYNTKGFPVSCKFASNYNTTANLHYMFYYK
jgi:hypothetical protein